MTNYIDAQTLQPRRFGELYAYRNLRVLGEARWLPSSNQVQTRGVRVINASASGGASGVLTIPDGTWTLLAGDSSVNVQLQRTAGPSTAILGTTFLQNVTSQPPPQENWIQLFYRSAQNEIVAFNGAVITNTPVWTRLGITRGNSIYDAVVGTNPQDPLVTHTNIQTAIDECVDGNRILILEGTYNITTGTGYETTAALSWSGKTLTLEGEGGKTVLVNGGTLQRAFAIRASAGSSPNIQGSASRIVNLTIQGFNQSLYFDSSLAAIYNCEASVVMTNPAAYALPATVGTFANKSHVVREQRFLSGAASLREIYVSNTAVTPIQISASSNRFMSDGLTIFEERMQFNRPTSGFGQIPIGGVIASFPNIPGTYDCSATTVADPATGFVQCAGQVLADTSSPMNGQTIPNINNERFLQGHLTSGTVSANLNTQNTLVPTNYSSAIANSGYWLNALPTTRNAACWDSVNQDGSLCSNAGFNKAGLNNDQIGHTHTFGSHTHSLNANGFAAQYIHSANIGGGNNNYSIYSVETHNSCASYMWTWNRVSWVNLVTGGINVAARNRPPNPSNAYGPQLDNSTADPATNANGQGFQIFQGCTRGIGLCGITGGSTAGGGTGSACATWNGVTQGVSGTTAFNKSGLNGNQTSGGHLHTVTGNVTGTATANTWNNRPSYITARFLMRVK